MSVTVYEDDNFCVKTSYNHQVSDMIEGTLWNEVYCQGLQRRAPLIVVSHKEKPDKWLFSPHGLVSHSRAIVPKNLEDDVLVLCAGFTGHSDIIQWEEKGACDDAASLCVGCNPYSIRDIPPSFLTEYLLSYAIQCDGLMLKYVPSALMTGDMIDAALAKNGNASRYVPKDLMTPERWASAVLSSEQICFIADVPHNARTYDMWRHAVSVAPDSLLSFPKEDMGTEFGQDIIRHALEKKPRLLLNVPERFRSQDVCVLAVQKDVKLIRNVPEHLKDTVLEKVEQEGATPVIQDHRIQGFNEKIAEGAWYETERKESVIKRLEEFSTILEGYRQAKHYHF